MQLVVIGTHQRIASLEWRERLAFTPADLPRALAALRGDVAEGLIVSTCNRVEVYGIVAGSAAPGQVLLRFLSDWHGLPAEEIVGNVYTFTGSEAVRHLFRLAAGLDSMVLGEDQILAQIKAALAEARAAGATGQLGNRLVHSALAAGKLVRTRTDIARNHLSVVSVGLDAARDQLGDLRDRRVVVVGAGRMAELALKHFRRAMPRSLRLVNRTTARARALASGYPGVEPLSLDRLADALAEADLVVSATAAPDVVITKQMVERAVAARQAPERSSAVPLLLLDLAVPHDVDRAAAEVSGARRVDVDDLRPICEANRLARTAEVATADALIDAEVARFDEWWSAQQVVPTIRALREHAEAIRVAELERTLARLSSLSEREQELVRALSVAVVNKLLHQPIVGLKDPDRGSQLNEAVQQLFGLPSDRAPSVEQSAGAMDDVDRDVDLAANLAKDGEIASDTDPMIDTTIETPTETSMETPTEETPTADLAVAEPRMMHAVES